MSTDFDRNDKRAGLRVMARRLLTSILPDVPWGWSVLYLSILGVGLAVRLVEITNDPFDYDEYACMMNIGQAYSNYLAAHKGSYFLSLLTHYWLSYRLLGDSLVAYRLMSLIAGVAFLLLTAVCLGRFWPSNRGFCLTALLVLILNRNVLYLTRYSMFSYGNSLLVSAGLLFLFMQLAEGSIERKQWRLITALFVPASLFSNITMMVPLAAGTLLVILFRWLRFAGFRNLASLRHWLWELKPLLLFPFTYLLTWAILPFSNLGADKRLSMAAWFFPTSGFPPDLRGIIQFILIRTSSLFWYMLAPDLGDRIVEIVVVFLCTLLVIVAMVIVAKRRADQRTVFTSLFLLSILGCILIAGLLGLYPYGSVRYTPYLVMPFAILIGFGASSVCRWIAQKSISTRTATALLTFSSIMALTAGSYLVAFRYNSFASMSESDQEAISWMRTSQPDLTLVDDSMAVVLAAKAPEVYKRSHSMGWEIAVGKEVLSPELVAMITGVTPARPAESILVISHHRDMVQMHPQWNSLLASYYSLDSSAEGAHIWVGLYRRKGP